MAYYDPTASWLVQGRLRAVYKTGQISNVNAKFLLSYRIDYTLVVITLTQSPASGSTGEGSSIRDCRGGSLSSLS